MLRRNALILAGLATTAVITGCGSSDDPAPVAVSLDIVELAQATPDLSILV